MGAQGYRVDMQAKTTLKKVKINGKTAHIPCGCLITDKEYETKRKDIVRREKAVDAYLINKRIDYQVTPPLEERLKVFNYLLQIGFSHAEADKFDPFSKNYETALLAMKYQELCNKNKVTK